MRAQQLDELFDYNYYTREVGKATMRLEVQDGVLPLPGLGVSYRELSLVGEFEGDRLLIRRAGATSAKGTLETTGEIRFASVTRIEMVPLGRRDGASTDTLAAPVIGVPATAPPKPV